MKENKQPLKNELKEDDESKVSGGYAMHNKNSKHDAFQGSSGRTLDLHCDFCGKKFEGRGVIEAPGDRDACIDCYKKLCEIKQMGPNVSLGDHIRFNPYYKP